MTSDYEQSSESVLFPRVGCILTLQKVHFLVVGMDMVFLVLQQGGGYFRNLVLFCELRRFYGGIRSCMGRDLLPLGICGGTLNFCGGGERDVGGGPKNREK